MLDLPVVCQKSIAGSCGAPMVEVEQSAEPLAAFDRCVPIGGSHGLLDEREQPVAMVARIEPDPTHIAAKATKIETKSRRPRAGSRRWVLIR